MASRRARSDRALALSDSLRTALNRLEQRFGVDRLRLRMIGAAAALLLLILGVQMTGGEHAAPAPLADAGETTRESTLDPTAAESPAAPAPAADETQAIATTADPEPVEAPEPPGWQYVQVASGDTLEIIFRRLGLSPRLLHEIVHLNEHGRGLARLDIGDELAFSIDSGAESADQGFRAIRAELDEESWVLIERASAESELASRVEPRLLETRVVEVSAEITSSLFNAGKNAGLSDNMILRLAGIFGWDIDFALDIRRGDRFALVFEEIYRDGQFLRQGSILGARFINRGRNFEAVRFDAGNGPDYFDPEGRPMRKQFLRAPLNFTRVTSNFNPRRFHPVTRRTRPHNGTDYGADVGTPVWAAGDGTVIEAGYGAANGNYIFIKHGNHIVTRYLHLSRKMVRRGDRVRQGQTIGLVGATGLVTGPHLHYEFLVHGKHRNPRTVDLPEAQPLPEDVLPEFRRASAGVLEQLEQLLPPRIQMASNDTIPSTPSSGANAEPDRQAAAPK